jgi:protein phosphatase
MKLTIPKLSLVALVGASGSGKSTFAARHFPATAVLSSDTFRALVADDSNDQTVSTEAFAALHFVARQRLKLGRLTVVDATNVQAEARKPLLELARRHHVLPVAIVLDLPERVCRERNAGRPDRDFGQHVVRQHVQQVRRSVRTLQREGFRYVYVLSSVEEVESAEIELQPLWTDRRDEHGPFDIIGDVHGCFEELAALLERLGYEVSVEASAPWGYNVSAPAGRKAVFLGDLVDRGPKVTDVLRLVMSMRDTGVALCVPGNHESKLLRKLQGRNVQITHGLQESLDQIEREPAEFRDAVTAFLDSLVSHHVLDEGRLVVAHAGMKEELQGRSSARVRDFALYGETTGETDEYGLPVRYNWAEEYRGAAMVVYGHTPVPDPVWLNRTICIDAGCVFGGRLTALRYPERELVAVKAEHVYYEPARPLAESVEDRAGAVLDIEDVTGKKVIATRLRHNVTIRSENAAAALEVMSRFAVDPRWLIYLPPTMSPCATNSRHDLLEHPAEALAYYRDQGIQRVICEEKHMGSRAVAVVCQSPEAARERFGASSGESGTVFTRTGRPFFRDQRLLAEFIESLREALTVAGFWQRFDTSWFCIDGEILPWSLKARDLLAHQYAPVAAAGRSMLGTAHRALAQASVRGVEMQGLEGVAATRLADVESYAKAYGRYCWDANDLGEVRFAPFQMLAAEGRTFLESDHEWQMQVLTELARSAPGLVQATEHLTVDLNDPGSEEAAVAWWERLTDAGGEGMVVKPLGGLVTTSGRLLQPGIKCRGREYLRIIYGPEYTAPANLARLRSRGLASKRSLAEREFALGVEALERFVAREPLYRVHQCVFGVLALESEPVDPRL